MNLDYYIKKKHIFKNRAHKQCKVSNTIKCNELFIYTVKQFKFEYVYLRLLKKLFRRKFIKSTTRFYRQKYWVNLTPNYLLTQKSKNSRMGAGVGKFIRLVSMVKPKNTLIKAKNYNYKFLLKIVHYLRYKIHNKFLIK